MCRQISSVDDTCFNHETSSQWYRRPYYTRLSKTHKPGNSFYWRVKVYDQEPRKDVNSFSQAAAKTPSVELITNTPCNVKTGRCSKSVALSLRKNGSFCAAQRDVLITLYYVEDVLEDGVLLDWTCTAIRPSTFSVLHVTNKRLSVSAILQAPNLPACGRAYIFLSMKDVKISKRIGCYQTSCDSVRGIFSQSPSRLVAKKYWILEQWLWRVFLLLGEGKNYEPLIHGPVWLGRSISFSERDFHATQSSVRNLYVASFRAVSFDSTKTLRG